MARADVSRWAQRSVVASALFLLAWHLAALAGAPRRVLVVLGLYGFVLHMVFAKALSLVPSYFERQLTAARAPALAVPLTVVGTLALAADAWAAGPGVELPAGDTVAALGPVAWAAGVALFLGAVGWTIRDNLAGRETGTGEANRDRRRVDRVANAFVPLALAYLAVGSYAPLAARFDLPWPLLSYAPVASHLLAAGAAALLVFAIGFRLLPRFMVATPPRGAVFAVLPAGALGPVLIAAGITGGPLLHAGATLEAIAVVGYAATVTALFVRSDRDRVGFWGPLAGGVAGVLAVGIGLWLAFAGRGVGLIAAHLRLNVLGLLGLTIVGLAYQFYPPGAGTRPGSDDRTALVSIALLAGGLLAQAIGAVAGLAALALAGTAAGAVGAALYAYLVVGLLVERGSL